MIKLVRVLVVEDKEDTRAALVSLLSLQGHIVRQASGGKEALTEIVEHPSDIALIDIGLSDIDGYELARRIRGLSLRRRVYLVAVTGYGQPRDVQHSLEAGFDFHLTKPVAAKDIESLFRRIAPAVSADSDDVSAERPAA